MKELIKETKIDDALPTVFGLIGTLGVILLYLAHDAVDLNILSLMISGGVLLAFVTSAASVTVAVVR